MNRNIALLNALLAVLCTATIAFPFIFVVLLLITGTYQILISAFLVISYKRLSSFGRKSLVRYLVMSAMYIIGLFLFKYYLNVRPDLFEFANFNSIQFVLAIALIPAWFNVWLSYKAFEIKQK
jgi:hypothetical protein